MAAKGMLYWLPVAARQMREEAGRKQVHIAAGADLDQSVIANFELRKSTPRYLDDVVAAYSDDLDIPESEFWKRAIELWESASEELQLSATVDAAADEIAETSLDEPGSDETGRREAG